MIVITGAAGQLGRLVISELLKTVPAAQIVAAVRHPGKASDLAALGVQLRVADYSEPATLDSAFAGADKLLLISSNELGQRIAQHRNVIDAAKRAKVGLIAFTSLLHADSSPLALTTEYKGTEALLKDSGLGDTSSHHPCTRNSRSMSNNWSASDAKRASITDSPWPFDEPVPRQLHRPASHGPGQSNPTGLPANPDVHWRRSDRDGQTALLELHRLEPCVLGQDDTALAVHEALRVVPVPDWTKHH